MPDLEQLEQESKLYPWIDDNFMGCDEMMDFFDEANLFDELEEEEQITLRESVSIVTFFLSVVHTDHIVQLHIAHVLQRSQWSCSYTRNE